MEVLLLFIFVTAISFGLIMLLTVVKGVSRIFIRSDKSQSTYANQNRHAQNKSFKNQKIFGQNEGQYVGYEEIKE